MPAYFESGFYHEEGGVPWHKSGTPITEALTGKQALELSGGQYVVDTAPSYADITYGDPPQTAKKPNGGVTIYRTDSGEILGKSGSVYVPYQNAEMTEWFQPIIESGLARYETGGVLLGGKCVWFLCKVQCDNSEIVKGDEIRKYILLSNWHNGMLAIRVGFTPIRVVCANTEAFAVGHKASNILHVKHTSQTKTNLIAIRDAINIANQRFEMTAEQYKWLAGRVCNPKDLESFVKIVLNVADKKPEDISTRTKNTMDEIIHLAVRGRGNDLPGVRGSWWAAYNGVSEWLNYQRGHNEHTRLNSLWFGQGAVLNQKALSTALDLAG